MIKQVSKLLFFGMRPINAAYKSVDSDYLKGLARHPCFSSFSILWPAAIRSAMEGCRL